MAVQINLPHFPEFELHPRDTITTCFEKYTKYRNNMFEAMNITRASQKKAMFLHCVGRKLVTYTLFYENNFIRTRLNFAQKLKTS